jgi:hypothetical protein
VGYLSQNAFIHFLNSTNFPLVGQPSNNHHYHIQQKQHTHDLDEAALALEEQA